jgi:dimethylargininase
MITSASRRVGGSYIFDSITNIGSRTTVGGRLRSVSKQPKRYRYSLAITREIPSSFVKAVTKFAATENDGPISVARAKEQKDQYQKALRRFVPTLCLPALDEHPDSVFVEDTVVAIGNKAVITTPGHPSRRGEVDTIRDILLRLGYETIDMGDYPSALCDGGDVLYTGRHVFVGLSERTNQEAANILADTFSVDVISVPFEGEALHLKSIVTHMNESTLLAPTGSLGDEVLTSMNAKNLGYNSVRLPSMLACNVVSVNGGILAQDTGCEESKTLLSQAAKKYGLQIEFLEGSEFAKCDGALTCCSVLLEI